MPHSVPEVIKLQNRFNKPIMPSGMKSKSKQRTQFGIQASRDRSGRVSAQGVLDKQIAVYRMWYRFLQLALEMESLGVHIITKEKRVPLKKPKKDAWGHIRKSEVKSVKVKVKVNRQSYSEWSIDKIPNLSFDDWWKGSIKNEVKSHRDLFFNEPSILVKSKNDFVESDHYQYIRVDKRKRVNDVVVEVRQLLNKKSSDRTAQALSKYQVYGMPNIDTLINRYNALIQKVTTLDTDEDIFKMGLFRSTQIGMKKYKVDGMNYGRMMRDLILPAKITLLSVCDGFFVTNPNKKYV